MQSTQVFELPRTTVTGQTSRVPTRVPFADCLGVSAYQFTYLTIRDDPNAFEQNNQCRGRSRSIFQRTYGGQPSRDKRHGYQHESLADCLGVSASQFTNLTIRDDSNAFEQNNHRRGRSRSILQHLCGDSCVGPGRTRPK